MLSQRQLLDLGLAPDLESLRRQLIAAAEDLGFGLVTTQITRGDLRSGRAWIKKIANTPTGFNEAQDCLDDTLRDPVMAGMMAGPAPVVYDQNLYVDAGMADLWDAQAPFGYKVGIACCLQERSHAEQFMFGVDRPDPLPKERAKRAGLTGAVQLLTVHTQSAMQRLLTPQPSGSPALAPVELECLRWASNGLKVWQVGDKVSISDAHVRRYQHLAARKLGVKSTPAAVLRCIQVGLIGR